MFGVKNDSLEQLIKELKKHNELSTLTLLLQIERRLDEPDCLKMRIRLSNRNIPFTLPDETELTDAKEKAEVMEISRILDSYLAVLESFAILFERGYIDRNMIYTSSISRTLGNIHFHPELNDYVTCAETIYPNLASMCRELWSINL